MIILKKTYTKPQIEEFLVDNKVISMTGSDPDTDPGEGEFGGDGANISNPRRTRVSESNSISGSSTITGSRPQY